MKMIIETKATPNGSVEVEVNGRYVGTIEQAGDHAYRAYGLQPAIGTSRRRQPSRHRSIEEAALRLATKHCTQTA